MKRTPEVIVGLPFLAILTLIFITLKLAGHIAWSWWWVLAPTWIPLAIILAFLAVWVGILLLISAAYTRRGDWQ